MKKKVVFVLAIAVGVFAGARAVRAHHSLALYDMEHVTILKGTVTEFNFINPHVQVHIDAKDDKGNVEKWIMDLLAPARLSRVGWNAESLKVGDQITMYCHPYKDGSKHAYLEKAVLPGGQELSNRTANAN